MRLQSYKERLMHAIPIMQKLGKKTDYLEKEVLAIKCKDPNFTERIELDSLFANKLGRRYDSIYMTQFESWSVQQYGQVVAKEDNAEIYEERYSEFLRTKPSKTYRSYRNNSC